MAVLAPLKEFTLLCGGSILDPRHVLTAAHCTFYGKTGEEEPIPPRDFEVIAGTSDLNGAGATAQVREVAKVRVHPYFNIASITGGDDVAVLELSEPLKLEPLQAGSAVAAIPLVAPGASPPEGAQVNLTGFGAQSESEPLPRTASCTPWRRRWGSAAAAVAKPMRSSSARA